MSTAAEILFIRLDAVASWVALSRALDRMEDRGRRPVCEQRPDQGSSDAKPAARADAAEACKFCSALHACAFAEANEERHGVWGGTDRTDTRIRKAKVA